MRNTSRVLAGAASLAALSPLERTVQAQPSFPTDGLVRYYNFDEGQGTIASDLTGNHPLTVSDSWTLQGKLNSAYVPNGNNYNTSHNPFNQPELSLNFWMKRTAPWSNYNSIIGTGNGNGTFILGTAGTQSLYLGLNQISPGVNFNFDGNYHMLTLAIADGNQRFYIDGAQQLSFSLPFSFGDKAVKIFGGLGGLSPNNIMNVDELAIWNRFLKPSDISDLYNKGQGLSCPLPEPSTIALTVGSAALLAPRRRKSN